MKHIFLRFVSLSMILLVGLLSVNRAFAEGNVRVTFTYKQSVETYKPAYIAAYNKDVLNTPYLSGATSDAMELPAGTYDFIVVFDHNNSNYSFGKEGTNIIIKEGVEVASEMSVEFDATEATNTIKMVAYNPDGALCKVPTKKYIDANYNTEVVEEGNIAETLVFKSVIHKDYGRVYNLGTNGGNANFVPGEISTKQHNSDDFLAFHVNTVSDKYMFQQLRFMPTGADDSKSYVVTLRQLGSNAGEVRNEANSYFDVDEYFVASLNHGAAPRFPYSISFGMAEDEKAPFYSGFSWANENAHHLAVSPGKEFEGFEAYKTQVTFSKVEVKSGGTEEYAINAAPVRFSNHNDVVYYPVNPIEFYQRDAMGNVIVTRGAEALAFTPAQKKQVNGSGVPVALFIYAEQASPYGPVPVPSVDIEYMGRLGERYNMDKAFMQMSIAIGGTEVWKNDGSNGSLSDFCNQIWRGYPGYPDNLVEINATVTNTKIDENIEGTNTSLISFDQRKADKFAPVVQMLQFRDQHNNVTDRIDYPRAGRFIIAGGDFVQKTSEVTGTYGEAIYYYALEEAAPSIEVSYAKHGATEFHTLNTEILPDNTFKPGFGLLWGGSLANIEDIGWFDMKIKLTDAAGNYSEQTISPAFYIKDKTAPAVAVTGVTVAPETAEMTVGGEILRLTATVAPAEATDKSVIWASANKAVATVDAEGVVTAVAEGEADITVTTVDGGFKAVCKVKVKPGAAVAVTGVSVEPKTVEMKVGDETIRLVATVTPAEATNKDVLWTSSDRSVARVDAEGVVTAVAEGEADITVTTADGGFKAVCKVKVKPGATVAVSSVSIDPKTAEMTVGGETLQLTATVSPAGATDKMVQWTSSNRAVATVNASGVVTAVSAGEADITVTTVDGGFKAVCKVTVKPATVAVMGVSIEPKTAKMTVGGETLQLVATVSPAEATDKTVKWTSSNEAVAKVNASGVVTAVSAGEADITVTTVDGGFTAVCKVTVEGVANEREIMSAALSVYPNPTTGLLYVDVIAPAVLEVFTTDGHCIFRKAVGEGLQTVMLDKSGFYFVRLTSDEWTAVKRVVRL